MKDKLKKRLQCRDCDMPYCDISCNDLSDSNIDWIMELTNQRVIEELEEVLTKEIEAFGVNVISSQAVINKIKQLKQD